KTLSPATDFSNCAKHTSILSQSSVTHGSCGSCTATTHLESIVPTTSLVPFPEHDLVVCGDRVDPLGFQSYPQYFNPWQFRDWLRSAEDADERFEDFATGTGPIHRDYGPDSAEVHDLKNSLGVEKARDYYARCGNGRTVSGGHPFGLRGL